MNQEREQARIDELLSAYIDGELAPETRAELEDRMEREPELRQQLEGLRQTVALVRGLPQVEAPRHFLITPAMVADAAPQRESGKRRSRSIFHRWLAPALSFATAVSTLLLAITLATSFLGGQTDQLASPFEPTEPVGVAEIPEVDPAPEETGDAPPEMLLTAPTGEPSETPMGMQAVETPSADGAAESEPAPTNGEATPTSELAGGGDARGTPTPEEEAAEDEERPEAAASPTPPAEERSFEAPTPTGTPLPVAEAPEETPAIPPQETASGFARWVMPASLGLLTLIMAVATALAWRARGKR